MIARLARKLFGMSSAAWRSLARVMSMNRSLSIGNARAGSRMVRAGPAELATVPGESLIRSGRDGESAAYHRVVFETPGGR